MTTPTAVDQVAEILDGYLRAALWSWDPGYTQGTHPFGYQDDTDLTTVFTPDALQAASQDCMGFLAAALVASPAAAEAVRAMDPRQLGHDLWLTRHEYGIGGFGRRGLGAAGVTLSTVAVGMGPAGLHVAVTRHDTGEPTYTAQLDRRA